MKKCLQRIIILMFMMLIPFVVEAEISESDLTSVRETFKTFDVGKISVYDVSYTHYNKDTSSKGENISISAGIVNNYNSTVQLNAYLNLYDENKKLIEQYVETKKIVKLGKILFGVRLYESELKINISDIKYYSFSIEVFSDVDSIEKSNNDSYYVDNYDLNIKVNENNIYNVERKFNAVFKKFVNKIELSIPFRHVYERANGEVVNKRAIISNIQTDDKYNLETKDGLRTVLIGEKKVDSTIKEFALKYDYNVGKDTLKDNDEFFFYLAKESDIRIDKFNFEIELPKEFDENSIKFIDEDGKEVNDILYVVIDNKISGSVMSVINPGDTYAIRIVLDDEYFLNASSNISLFTILSFGTSILAVLVIIVFWLVTKKNKDKIKYNSLYFNENINSMEMGYLYNGYVKDNDIATLVFSLANKGFIKIEKNKKSYKIIKVKEYDGNDRIEKYFMHELFSFKNELTKKELLYSLKDMHEILSIKVENVYGKGKIFEHKLFNKKLISWILIFIILLFNMINILLEYQPSLIAIHVIVSFVGYIILISGIFDKNRLIEKIIFSLVAIILIISPIILSSYKAFLQDCSYLIIYLLGIMAMILIFGISYGFGNRTRYGNVMLYKIRAYKEYLINCNDLWIDKALKKNDNCFYDVLPYALVLGISDKWCNKFKEKELKKPSWYICEKFNLDDFYSDVKNIYSDIFVSLKNSGSNE